ncbi:DUF692 domain-containing protein [Asticcacaulis excentricus]|uniref:Uncharacterized protein conserved in bacteria n=1 Tax=Asticcacaulis excentricus TaxID=78587 RepID=A0A3G9G7D7_9CAUL|nr:DUF692 domain-containing protein [Asticcacaulis excentricus]BBF82596.1 uncharacterized protein conserved in bacteria [Asticcacaulis excentricus]
MPPSLAPFSGFGLGLRPPHYEAILAAPQPVDFFEIISENFMIDGGRPLHVLDQVRADYPVAMHGVSMSLGSPDGPGPDYLRRLHALMTRVDPLWVSDHLCWTGVNGHNSHDLLPLPLTEEAMATVCRHIDRVQTFLQRPLLIENPSTYVTFAEDTYTEWGFLSELCRRTGCYLLLDINNVFVSAHNHGFSAQTYLNGLPLERVCQVHLAGHSEGETLLIDTHDAPVPDGVWALWAEVAPRLSHAAVTIERDDEIPPLPELLSELDTARRLVSPVVYV